MLESGDWHLDYLLSWRGLSTHPPLPCRNQQVEGCFKDKEGFSTLSSLELGTYNNVAMDAKILANRRRKNRSLVLHPNNWALRPVQGDLGFSTVRIIMFFFSEYPSLPQVKRAKSPANSNLNVALPPAACDNHIVFQYKV